MGVGYPNLGGVGIQARKPGESAGSVLPVEGGRAGCPATFLPPIMSLSPAPPSPASSGGGEREGSGGGGSGVRGRCLQTA